MSSELPEIQVVKHNDDGTINIYNVVSYTKEHEYAGGYITVELDGKYEVTGVPNDNPQS